jgi:DNA-binding NtrC family response regulator
MPVTQDHMILVIDPDQSLQELFRDLFLLEGYAVEARSALRPESLRDTSPAAVVYGLGWGDEAAGIVALRSLLDHRPDGCGVMVCTADPAQIATHQAELDALGIPLVSKPFDIETLLGIIQDGIAAHPSDDGRMDGSPSAQFRGSPK